MRYTKKQKREEAPSYPSLRQAGLGRRDFLALLGGGVALGLFGACSPVISTGGVAPHPHMHSLRLPGSNSHATYLGDGSYLSYIVWTQHENERFNGFATPKEKDLLQQIDQLLKKYNHTDFSGKKANSKVTWAIRSLLEDIYMKEKKEDIAFMSLRLEVVRLQQQEPLTGDVERPSPRP
jgi:hypothetical protein